MPHGMCYLWNPAVLWLNAASDALIALAYYTIPILLFAFARKRKDLTFQWVFVAFGAFILACGTTHAMGVWVIWHPAYRLDGLIKAITAGLSVMTAALLFPLLPALIHLPSPAQLRAANEKLAREIELRKGMARILERQAELLELAQDAIFVRGLDGTIQFWNRGAENLYGWPKALAEGAIKQNLLQPVFPEPYADIQRELMEMGRWNGEVCHTKRDGTTLVVSTCWALRADDIGVEVLEINRDMTEQKQYQEDLRREMLERRRAEEQLQFEIVLREKNRELETANQAKDRFLASMNQQLRTPLNDIISAGTLLTRLSGSLTADQEKQVRTIQISGKHLLSLINDLLDLAKIASGKLELRRETVNCAELLEEIASHMRPIAEGKHLGFSILAVPPELTLQTDRRALYQILLKLANNAVKFTRRGSVRLEVREKVCGSDVLIEFTISDTGRGMRAEDQRKLFRAFSKLDLVGGGTHEGTGLGLHLSQKLADMIRAQITL